jgi:hypothetical protein
MSCGGSHLGFRIGINKNFLEDLEMIIPGQFFFQMSKWFKRRSVLKHFSHSNVKLSPAVAVILNFISEQKT